LHPYGTKSGRGGALRCLAWRRAKNGISGSVVVCVVVALDGIVVDVAIRRALNYNRDTGSQWKD
jgi:hypothetical protein